MSFIVSAVDNPDSVKNHLRFMDATQNVNSYGRAEIRHFDGWHGLCGKGDNAKLAGLLCRSAGYR